MSKFWLRVRTIQAKTKDVQEGWKGEVLWEKNAGSVRIESGGGAGGGEEEGMEYNHREDVNMTRHS